MLTGTIRSQIDQIWNAFWSGGVSNPLSVIEQLTFLLFIKRLDEIHTREENKAEMMRIVDEHECFERLWHVLHCEQGVTALKNWNCRLIPHVDMDTYRASVAVIRFAEFAT
tara:strand:+ start:1209 stop:1541 length:333 start_codon:yes stop_codon:yes gene_type:complete